MAILFDRSKQNICLYILIIFNEKELLKDSVVKESLTTGLGGKKIDTINKIDEIELYKDLINKMLLSK